jgi:hypothetical protein
VAAGLGDRHDVQCRVDGAVAKTVEPVPDGLAVVFPGGHCNRSAAPPAVECTFGAEARRVPDFDEQRRGGDDADAHLLGQRRAAGVNQMPESALESLDAIGYNGDVLNELAKQVQVRAHGWRH